MPVRTTLGIAALTLAGTACAAAPPATEAPRDSANWPEQPGSLVYSGCVTTTQQSAPGYWYERRVWRRGNAWSAMHRTFATTDPAGHAPLVEQTVLHGDGYALVAYAEQHHQLGHRAEIAVEDEGIRFTVEEGGRRTTRRVKHRAPVVVGPTLFGFVMHHRARMARGERVALDFAVASRARLYRFVATQETNEGGTSRFRVRPRSAILRWVVGDLLIVFEPSSDRVVAYEGPIPVVDPRGRGLRARVAYSYPAGAHYR